MMAHLKSRAQCSHSIFDSWAELALNQKEAEHEEEHSFCRRARKHGEAEKGVREQDGHEPRLVALEVRRVEQFHSSLLLPSARVSR